MDGAFMNAFWLLIPLLAVRFGLAVLLDKTALKRAAFFPPLIGKEKAAYYVYQISNLFLFGYLFFLTIRTGGPLFITGLAVYGLGIVVCAASVYGFAKPNPDGINLAGIYRFTRNPMYIGYFVYFLGCALLTRSILLFAALALFQTATHWIILSEERWCKREFGEAYVRYTEQVRRYL
jgi:protein-S-isoprenylcysteine O-methyltransferase Ste14